MHLCLVKCIDRAIMQVVGAFEKDGQKLPQTLTGKWDTALEALMADGTKQTIWKVHPLPKVTSRCWPFSVHTPPPPPPHTTQPKGPLSHFMPAAIVSQVRQVLSRSAPSLEYGVSLCCIPAFMLPLTHVLSGHFS